MRASTGPGLGVLLVLLLSISTFSVGSSPQSHTDEGLKYLSFFDFQRALREFEAALELQPESEIARVNVGLAEYYLGQFADSLGHLEAAQQLNPDSPYVLFVLGILKRVTDRSDEAARLFERVVEIDPEDFGAYYQLGLIEFSAGRYERAITMFRKSLKYNPKCSAASYNLARALLRNDKLEEGRLQMEHFKRLRDQREIPSGGGMGDPVVLQGKYAQPRRLPNS